jgi:hypothetical protein
LRIFAAFFSKLTICKKRGDKALSPRPLFTVGTVINSRLRLRSWVTKRIFHLDFTRAFRAAAVVFPDAFGAKRSAAARALNHAARVCRPAAAGAFHQRHVHRLFLRCSSAILP